MNCKSFWSLTSCIGLSGNDPLVRPTYQAQGIDHLSAAVKLHPSNPSMFYHLAYANAEARRIDDAIEAIKTSIELEPANVPAWHLLALLLSARKDWPGASRATQVGVETWEIREEQLQLLRPPPASSMVEPPATETAPLGATVSHLDFALQQQRQQTGALDERPPIEKVLIEWEDLVALQMPRDTATIGPLKTADRLTEIIQLRITQAVIIEKTEGFNRALAKQHETFIYLSNKSHDIREEAAALHESVASIGSTQVTGMTESFIAVDEVAPHSESDSGQREGRVSTEVFDAASLKQTLSRSATRESHKSGIPPEPINSEKQLSTSQKHRFLAKHLHVPGSRKSQGMSQPAGTQTEPQGKFCENNWGR